MNLLLDTCTFIWIISEPKRLSAAAVQAYTEPQNSCFLSVVSEWELSVQVTLGRLTFSQPVDQLVPAERRRHKIQLLELSESAALYVPQLPPIHKDPFDRMLACSAIIHGMTIVTPDPEIRKYPVATLW